MNNKRLGSAFERKLCEILSSRGFWVHFISPDNTGAQPFDVIAVKKGKPYAIDCKTCEREVFSISRLETNQILAFTKWLQCENPMPLIAVLHDDVIYYIEFKALLEHKNINVKSDKTWFYYDEELEHSVIGGVRGD